MAIIYLELISFLGNQSDLGLYPDYTIRFFNKHHGKFTLNQVHEKIELVSKPSFLTYPMNIMHTNLLNNFIANKIPDSTLGANACTKSNFKSLLDIFQIIFY